LGVSVEDRQRKDRIDHLRAVPAAVRFLSVEPLLEDVGDLDLTGIHWVIVGSESGHGARPMNEDWARSLRDQCAAAGVAFFYKQRLNERGRKVSLPMLDGRQWTEFPEVRQ
jgi:protein gp37